MPLPRAWVPAERYQLRRTGARPLERAAILLADDGQILIDKGRPLGQEIGQWLDLQVLLRA